MNCDPIGHVETPFESRSEAPRQGLRADVEGVAVVDPAYEAGLEGIEPGDTLDLVWWADEADRDTLVVRRGGVFGTRSPDRPVPICVTTVTVLDVGGCRIRVEGVDMLDGTPLLDVKASLGPR